MARSPLADAARHLDRQTSRAAIERDLSALAVPPALGPAVDGGIAPLLPPLTKEQAMADTLRALKECFPDRWERIWDALGKESASDRAVSELTKAGTANPAAAMGALIGGVLGAALGSTSRPPRR